MESYSENAGESSSASSFSDESNGENQSLNHEPSNLVEHSFMSQAMRTPARGNALFGAHNSSGNLRGNTIEATHVYHFPTSNLPPEYRLDFSNSRSQFPQTEQRNCNGSSLGNPNWINWQHFSQIPSTNLGSQGYGFQALLNQAIASDDFHLNHDRSLQQRIMNSWPDPSLQLLEYMSLGEGNRRPNIAVPGASSSRETPNPKSKVIMNKLYDPAYAAMGLPVDPHLRMLHLMNAKKRNQENGNNNEEEEDD
ncbi:hypothetical protein V6N13_013893 [Hibiscus sabdariffa]|uniref:Uncharacterized protein n=1 Tax=Hibiscus sabdariffa TaxID=183260 RepID=A0ABR2RTJ3_9ROSI